MLRVLRRFHFTTPTAQTGRISSYNVTAITHQRTPPSQPDQKWGLIGILNRAGTTAGRGKPLQQQRGQQQPTAADPRSDQ